MRQKLIPFLPFLAFMPNAYAAEMFAWKSYLAVIMLVALGIAIKLTLNNPKAESRAAKILLTGLYFWVITFAELILLALIYHFTQTQ
ncbi:MAG: hypothetical protein Q9M92_03680 [Enterobacterales bacterium]|nr:hypothetical protein [Enterobacterales bacterium]